LLKVTSFDAPPASSLPPTVTISEQAKINMFFFDTMAKLLLSTLWDDSKVALYSSRNAVAGSTDNARCAGTAQAISATTIIKLTAVK
jgi:hypothetical protein